jgi:hypothetical protein
MQHLGVLDRWIGAYATQAVDLLARLMRDLEVPQKRGAAVSWTASGSGLL